MHLPRKMERKTRTSTLLLNLGSSQIIFEDTRSVLNCFSDSLYDVYSGKKSAKELWELLDRKYKSDDAGAKKFVVGRFLDYKMVDSKTMIFQVQDFLLIPINCA